MRLLQRFLALALALAAAAAHAQAPAYPQTARKALQARFKELYGSAPLRYWG